MNTQELEILENISSSLWVIALLLVFKNFMKAIVWIISNIFIIKQLTATLNGHTILMIDVPAKTVRATYMGDHLFLFSTKTGRRNSQSERIGPGWKLLGLASSNITEDMAAGLVEAQFDTYRDYSDTDNMDNLSCFTCATAIESLHSFIKSHDFNPSTTALLIKQ